MLIRLLRAIATFAVITAAVDFDPASTLSGGIYNVKYSGVETGSTALVIMLYAGGDTLDTAAPIGPPVTVPTPGKSGTAKITLAATAGPSDKNAYFLSGTETLAKGGNSVFYSNRFSISGMTGEFPAAGTNSAAEVEAAYKKVASDAKAVPADAEAGAPADTGNTALTGEAIAYSLQTTGLTKMAPMQQKPGTKMTTTNTKPLYPTSSYKLATKALPMVSFKFTQTASRTNQVESRPNTGAAAEMPTDDMARFLNRWKD